MHWYPRKRQNRISFQEILGPVKGYLLWLIYIVQRAKLLHEKPDQIYLKWEYIHLFHLKHFYVVRKGMTSVWYHHFQKIYVSSKSYSTNWPFTNGEFYNCIAHWLQLEPYQWSCLLQTGHVYDMIIKQHKWKGRTSEILHNEGNLLIFIHIGYPGSWLGSAATWKALL